MDIFGLASCEQRGFGSKKRAKTAHHFIDSSRARVGPARTWWTNKNENETFFSFSNISTSLIILCCCCWLGTLNQFSFSFSHRLSCSHSDSHRSWWWWWRWCYSGEMANQLRVKAIYGWNILWSAVNVTSKGREKVCKHDTRPQSKCSFQLEWSRIHSWEAVAREAYAARRHRFYDRNNAAARAFCWCGTDIGAPQKQHIK